MTERLRVAVVEDEPPARAALRGLVERDPRLELSCAAAGVEEALPELLQRPARLLFLDIQLGPRTGFDLLEALGPSRPKAVVFVTASEEHAVRAFDVAAVDYLLKPFDDHRFQLAVSRARDRLQLGADVPDGRLALRDGARATFLRLDEIDWIEAQDYYVEVHAGAQTWLHRETLQDLLQRLDSSEFARIHRSLVVRVDRIREVRSLPSGDGSIVLRDGTELRLSRSRREALHRVLGL
ncbi:MAG TPA: LytTR family DNA-binding domain-containing protein [Myxococcales bacterium]|jgi:two-component system LytT family response regulator